MDERASILDLYEDAPCGFLSISPAGIIVRVNHTLTEWLELTASDLLGSPLYKLLSPGGRIAYETHIKPLLRMQGYVDELSFDFLNAHGDRVPFIANVAERRDDAGEHISTRFALFRAKDRRVFEENLMAARQTAETESQQEKETALLREQFIAVLGHDLRNPLAAIISGISILKRRGNLHPQDLAVIDGMNESAWRAANLVKDVLDFARGRMGQGLSLQRSENDDLASTLTQVIDEIRISTPDRDMNVNIAIDGSVFCDAERIAQLLSNLLSNAITHGDPAREINVVAQTEAYSFILSVENFGEPIPEASRENLFQPFFRADVRESREGLGLGLFIVSEIAKAHDGEVRVISNDASTRFTLTMPLNAYI